MTAIFGAPRNTDTVAAPTPDGVATDSVLRSQDSPPNQDWRLTLPAGAHLQMADATREPASAGAAEVVRNGRRLVMISRPTASDADKRPVAVSMSVKDTTLHITANLSGDIHFPVAIDPTYSWSGSSWPGWWGGIYNPPDGGAYGVFAPGTCWYWGCGLYADAFVGHPVQAFSNAAYYWYSPYGTYISDAWWGNITTYVPGSEQWNASAYYPYWYQYDGIEHNGQWKTTPTSYGTGSPELVSGPENGAWHYRSSTPNYDANPDAISFGFSPTVNGWTDTGIYYVAAVSATIGDTTPPQVTSVTPPAGWVSGTGSIIATLSDVGLGPNQLWVNTPNTSGGTDTTPSPGNSCSYTYTSTPPCPGPFTQTWPFSTANMPEGANQAITVSGNDYAGNLAPAVQTTINVDRSPPAIVTPSGTLWDHRDQPYGDQRDQGLYDPSYTLSTTAQDTLSGVADITAYIDVPGDPGHQLASASQGACDGCALPLTATLNSDQWGDGSHTIYLIAHDAAYYSPGADPALHTATTTIPVTIDRHGDVYQATETDGDPNNGANQLATETVQPGTHNARRDDGTTVTTRDSTPCTVNPANPCGDVRTLAHSDPGDDQGGDSYSTVRGASDSDPSLDIVAGILEPGSQSLGAPTSTGPMDAALQPWQAPPPAHGPTYAYYETAQPTTTDGNSDTQITKLWIDTATQLPVHRVTVVSGQPETEVFYTYGHRLQSSSLPADEFVVGRPINPVSDSTVDYATNPPPSGPPPEPPPSDSDMTAASAAFRQDFGLSTDPALIQSTLHDPTADPAIDVWGVPLTPAETQEMSVRQGLGDNLGLIESYVAGNPSAAAHYAGMYIDQPAGGLVYIGFTPGGDTTTYLNDLKARFPYPDRLRTFSPVLTLTQLDALRDQVTNDTAWLLANGFDLATIYEDQQTNAINIGVPLPNALLQVQLLTRYGLNVNLIQADHPVQASGSAGSGSGPSRYGPIPPVLGGQFIQDITGPAEQCSAGFTLVSGRKFRLLTAGHCGRGEWGGGSTPAGLYVPIGPVTARTFKNGGKADAELIRIKPSFASKRVLVRRGHTQVITSQAKPGQARYDNSPVQARFDSSKGTPVCAAGVYEPKKRCGHLVAMTDIYECDDKGMDPKTKQCVDPALLQPKQFSATYVIARGDSGGAVYSGHTAWAINTAGGGQAPGVTFASPIFQVLQAFPGFKVYGTR